MSYDRIAWLVQGSDGGPRNQARLLADHIPGTVFLVASQPLGIESDEPFYEEDMIYPTSSVADALAALQPDVVVFHNFNEHVAKEAARIRVFAPTVARAGINILENLFVGGLYQQTVGPIIRHLQAVDHVVAPTEAVERDLRCLGIDTERITVIPTAVDASETTPPTHNAPFTVGSLSARLSPLKNQFVLAAALGALPEIDPTFTTDALLTGRPNEYAEAVHRAATGMGVDDRVHFLGYVDDPDRDFWPKVGVHALPSVSERHPSSVLEAAAAGVPTIVADAAWSEAFEDFPAHEPDAPHDWAETIYDLLTNDAKRVRVARAQQKYVEANYDVSLVERQYHDLFESVAETVGRFTVPAGVVR